MRDLGIPVVDSDPRSVAQVATETRRIGRLVGRAAKADALAASIARNIARARTGSAPTRPCCW